MQLKVLVFNEFRNPFHIAIAVGRISHDLQLGILLFATIFTYSTHYGESFYLHLFTAQISRLILSMPPIPLVKREGVSTTLCTL